MAYIYMPRYAYNYACMQVGGGYRLRYHYRLCGPKRLGNLIHAHHEKYTLKSCLCVPNHKSQQTGVPCYIEIQDKIITTPHFSLMFHFQTQFSCVISFQAFTKWMHMGISKSISDEHFCKAVMHLKKLAPSLSDNASCIRLI